jgi:hypothetical protein
MVIRRDKRVQMLFSDEEWAMLQDLAAQNGVTASDWVRLRVREGHAATFGAATSKRPKPKRK